MKQSRQDQRVGYFPTVGSAAIWRNQIGLPLLRVVNNSDNVVNENDTERVKNGLYIKTGPRPRDMFHFSIQWYPTITMTYFLHNVWSNYIKAWLRKPDMARVSSVRSKSYLCFQPLSMFYAIPCYNARYMYLSPIISTVMSLYQTYWIIIIASLLNIWVIPFHCITYQVNLLLFLLKCNAPSNLWLWWWVHNWLEGRLHIGITLLRCYISQQTLKCIFVEFQFGEHFMNDISS